MISVGGAGHGGAGAGDMAAGGLRNLARRHDDWIVRGARLGYAAKGAIYLVIGGLALRAAFGSGGGTTDSRGALDAIGATGGGRWLLLAIGIGLLAYALWAIVSAALDAEDRGDDTKGKLVRAAQAGRGLAYGALGMVAIRGFMHAGRTEGGGGAEAWSARVLDWPGGRWLLGLVGLGVIGYGIYQLYVAAHKNLRKRVHLAETGPTASTWVIRVARFGIAARGVVFAVIGWFVLQAAMHEQAERAGGTGESLSAISSGPHGALLLGIVAAGLISYGIWKLVNARYREIPTS